eukprot:5301567-Pyramimonas_sp.AAC.2
MTALAQAATKAKEELSSVNQTSINLPFITATPDGARCGGQQLHHTWSLAVSVYAVLRPQAPAAVRGYSLTTTHLSSLRTGEGGIYPVPRVCVKGEFTRTGGS